MKQIYFLSFFLYTSLSFCQLSVSPTSSSQASYIYVDGQLLFVNKNIQLTKNNQQDLEASIYLRNEGQLLQGTTGKTQNSGTGLLSVFQEGTSNAYNYNYWSMPVSDNINSNNNFGNTIFQPKTITKSDPVKITSEYNGTSSPLSISSSWIYTYYGSVYEDWYPVGNIFNVVPGQGFTMKGVSGTDYTTINNVKNNPGNQQRYDFRGKPNDGTYSLKIAKDKTILVGNPYPSALDLKKFLQGNSSTTGIAYFWDSRENLNSHFIKDYEGGYGAYSPGANAYTPAVFKKYNGAGEEVGNAGGSGEKYAREITPVAQGFMLIGSGNGSEVVFNNSQRVFQKENSQNSQFKSMLSKPNKTENSNIIPKLWLNITLSDLYVRQLLLGFREDATKNLDFAMDAERFDKISSDAAFLVEGKACVISVLPFNKEEHIPLTLNLDKQEMLNFEVASTENFNPSKLFIYDDVSKNYHNIKQENFKITLEKGVYQNRFYLAFSEGKPEVDTVPSLYPNYGDLDNLPEPSNPILSKKIEVFQNNSMKQLEIQNTPLKNIQQVNLYSLNGGLIFSKSIKNKEEWMRFSTSNLQNAVYIIKIETTHETIVKKVTIKN